MTELERGTPTSRHIRPELLLSFGLIFPERSQVLRAYYQDVDDRRRRRAGEFEDELLNAAQRSPDEIINLILNDERAGELFERGVQAALLTADERHRRALARAVASGLLANDEAEVNQRQFIFDALASLAEPHIHVLIQIAQPYPGYEEDKHKPPGERRAWGWSLEALSQHLPGLVPVLSPVVSVLLGNGLIEDKDIRRWVVTDYGKQAVRLLEEEDVEDS